MYKGTLNISYLFYDFIKILIIKHYFVTILLVYNVHDEIK